jgi:hypothetical protein
LIYNTEESYNRESEPSRYIYQLKLESGIEIQQYWLSLDIAVTNRSPIVITKNDFILNQLNRYSQIGKYKFSPSALNTYIDCPLNFYYRYVLDIAEEAEVSEDLDSAKFGNILHKAMDILYKPFVGKIITPDIIDTVQKNIDSSIKRSFAQYYGQENDVDFQYEGKNILGREIIKNYINKILEYDKYQTPYEIIGLEKRLTYDLPMRLNGMPVKIGLKGFIDRIDKKDNIIRIIDYKSGRDESSFKNIASLFDVMDNKRNKAVFQTFFYTLLYIKNHPEFEKGPVISGLYNLRELYNKDFDLRIKLKDRGAKFIDDIIPFMEEYEQYFKKLITEIFNPDIPFQHGDDKDTCMYCEHLGMPSDLNK